MSQIINKCQKWRIKLKKKQTKTSSKDKAFLDDFNEFAEKDTSAFIDRGWQDLMLNFELIIFIFPLPSISEIQKNPSVSIGKPSTICLLLYKYN